MLGWLDLEDEEARAAGVWGCFFNFEEGPVQVEEPLGSGGCRDRKFQVGPSRKTAKTRRATRSVAESEIRQSLESGSFQELRDLPNLWASGAT